MTELYLIEGFLGAGKTTLMRQIVPLFAGKRLAVIVNEFGRESVDEELLASLRVPSELIHSGSIFCACRSAQFEAVLARLAREGFDVVLTEASGLADPEILPALLAQNPALRAVQCRGCVCLIDAVNFHKVLATALVTKSQVACGDLLVLNKTDLASPEQLAAVRTALRRLNPDAPIMETTFGRIGSQALSALQWTHAASREGAPRTRDITLRSRTLRISPNVTPQEMRLFLKTLLPQTDRIKGFLRLADGVLYLAGCEGETVRLDPYDGEPAPARIGKLTVLCAGGKRLRAGLEAAMAALPPGSVTDMEEERS